MGSGPTSAATYCATVDNAIVRSITGRATPSRNNIYTAGWLLAFSSTGILVLALLAAIAIPIGFYDRIRGTDDHPRSDDHPSPHRLHRGAGRHHRNRLRPVHRTDSPPQRTTAITPTPPG